MKIRTILSAVAACAVAATTAVAAFAETAAITYQTSSYKFRNTLAQDVALYWDNDLGEAAEEEGVTFVDAEINGNGTYTVELNGVVDGGWNMLKLDTTIDRAANPDAVITITGVELNGAAVDFDADAAAMCDVDGSSLVSDQYSAYDFNISSACRAQLINVYDNVAAVPNEGYESVKITFEVSGLAGSAATDDTAASNDAAATTGADTKGESPDTGVEGVAAVAGLAIVAGGAVMLSKKRK
ncbi:MAG: LPXTG cell wall anchor domain-containing protein [Oscillospiraceae bacterium]